MKPSTSRVHGSNVKAVDSLHSAFDVVIFSKIFVKYILLFIYLIILMNLFILLLFILFYFVYLFVLLFFGGSARGWVLDLYSCFLFCATFPRKKLINSC